MVSSSQIIANDLYRRTLARAHPDMPQERLDRGVAVSMATVAVLLICMPGMVADGCECVAGGWTVSAA